ncbi:murein hydrolase activator EnvC family protein [Streptobacillus moniliformis]|uniref:murein hydrolase activator EnvC family protein n=1 Tax=Streptobacillus moniliformis TaxID=34105 RepID=UPI0007EEF25F|nr:peptidoglycan DD-metalloendopeptidase family protein [Streptobacillus moniliformis]
MKKKIMLFLSLLSLASFGNNIDKNKNRINQIDKQVKDNTNKINNNNIKINNAKKDEAAIKKEIQELDALISKLQREYNVIQNEYVSLLKEIGKSEKEIRSSIRKIEESSKKITEGKTDYSNKINTWNKVFNAKVFQKNSFSSESAKKTNDLIKVLEQGQNNIKKIEKYKQQEEIHKKNEEILKNKTQKEAKKVEKKKLELENKREELRKAKINKDRAVKNLQNLQDSLKDENKKIERTNSSLIAEKRRLEQQINAIIAAAKKREEDARKRAQGSNKNQSGNESTDKKEPIKAVVVPKGTGKFIMPINGTIIVAYGQEKTKGITSKGIEIRGSLGQAVKASDSGVVLYSGSLKGLGAVIMIDHGDFITVYGNLASVRVASGAKVSKGQTVGTLGRDSITKEPNLYFEVRKGVNYVNPANYL